MEVRRYIFVLQSQASTKLTFLLRIRLKYFNSLRLRSTQNTQNNHCKTKFFRNGITGQNLYQANIKVDLKSDDLKKLEMEKNELQTVQNIC